MKEDTDMSENQKFVSNVNAIRFYGGNSNQKNESVPEAKSGIMKLFSVPAEMYMVVGNEFINDVVRLLTSAGYVYKIKVLTKYAVFALQYQKP